MPSRSLSRRLIVLASFLAALAAQGLSSSARLSAQGDANTVVPPAAFKELKWRNVGATRGGRVTAYSGVRQQPHTFYFGGVGGGVWKTEDAGGSWVPVSDGQIATGSIGSIDVAPSNPNHVWVGTGSAAIRSNVIIGRGVYKSLDAGKTWQDMGLQGLRSDRRHQGPPLQHQHGVAGGARLAVRSQRRTRHLQDHRWRQDLEEDAVREQPDRRSRYRGGLGESRHPLRGDVQGLPQGLGHHQWRAGVRGRHLQVDRRRRDMEEDHSGSSGRPHRQDRHRHLAQQPEGALRDGGGASARRAGSTGRTTQANRGRW